MYKIVSYNLYLEQVCEFFFNIFPETNWETMLGEHTLGTVFVSNMGSSLALVLPK